jgi:hypothetical protein
MTSEAAIQQAIRLDVARSGIDLWRNQVGAAEDKTGRVIRYGLMNDSKNLNTHYKSSDLIGIRPIIVTPEMVGQTIGVFVALECKASDWKYRPNDEHTAAQLRFIDLVRRAGGWGGFACSVDEARGILRL